MGTCCMRFKINQTNIKRAQPYFKRALQSIAQNMSTLRHVHCHYNLINICQKSPTKCQKSLTEYSNMIALQICQHCVMCIATMTPRVTRRCSVLQCVALCCSALQCAVMYCSVLRYVAVGCSMLEYVVVCCSVLQCSTACCSMLHCATVRCIVLQCDAVCCNMMLCVIVCCSML